MEKLWQNAYPSAGRYPMPSIAGRFTGKITDPLLGIAPSLKPEPSKALRLLFAYALRKPFARLQRRGNFLLAPERLEALHGPRMPWGIG